MLEAHKQAWEERERLDRAVRGKYGLDGEFQIEPEPNSTRPSSEIMVTTDVLIERVSVSFKDVLMF